MSSVAPSGAPPLHSVEITPRGDLRLLSRREMGLLHDLAQGSQHELLRRCVLAVMNVGSTTDDTREVLEQHRDFDIEIIQHESGGLRLVLSHPPVDAFVDGSLIRGIRELLFAVLRDLVHIHSELWSARALELATPRDTTDAVFHILRNAGVLVPGAEPDLVVCWGGHSIGRDEYDYSKEVGYQFGLRELHVCTGCGAGAMKGPMKGATIGHTKQRFAGGRYIGITEPGIIAAESPNPIVNELVVMPDMEKRLEAFVRIAHGIVIFPGGVGTAEELLFLLGVLMHPANADVSLPLVLTGPAGSRDYFTRIDEFIAGTLGEQARGYYEIVTGDPAAVGSLMASRIETVRQQRLAHNESFRFNWRLNVDADFQRPFEATHESMAALTLHRDLGPHDLAVALRRVFSGVVAGNIKEEGIRAIEQHGPFEIRGERYLMDQLDGLLGSFVAQHRMKLPGKKYEPCYRIVT